MADISEEKVAGERPSSPRLEAITSLASSFAIEHGNALDNFAPPTDKELFEIPLRDFLHEAQLQRKLESTPEWGSGNRPEIPFVGFFLSLFKGKKAQVGNDTQEVVYHNEKEALEDDAENMITESISDSLSNANRMVKSASWGSVFFLITTDIL